MSKLPYENRPICYYFTIRRPKMQCLSENKCGKNSPSRTPFRKKSVSLPAAGGKFRGKSAKPY